YYLNFLNFIDEAIPYCIDRIREHAQSEQISLHGWSMAGIFVLLYTALRQPNYVKNLMVMASPIDSYSSGGIGKLYKKINMLLSKNHKIQQSIYQGIIPKKILH